MLELMTESLQRIQPSFFSPSLSPPPSLSRLNLKGLLGSGSSRKVKNSSTEFIVRTTTCLLTDQILLSV